MDFLEWTILQRAVQLDINRYSTYTDTNILIIYKMFAIKNHNINKHQLHR